MADVKISLFQDCPTCAIPWAYEANGKTYSHLTGMIDQERDRLIYYFCPQCKTRFEREDVQHSGPR